MWNAVGHAAAEKFPEEETEEGELSLSLSVGGADHR